MHIFILVYNAKNISANPDSSVNKKRYDLILSYFNFCVITFDYCFVKIAKSCINRNVKMFLQLILE